MIDILYSIAGWVIAISILFLVGLGIAFMFAFTIIWIVEEIKEIRRTREKLKNPRQFDNSGRWEYEEWEQILADPEGVYNG